MDTTNKLSNLYLKIKAFAQYDSELSFDFEHISYGTAGFRNKGNKLNKVAVRLAIATFIRSISIKTPIGIVISASHNPSDDNGFKIADLEGKMLPFEWELIYEEIVNSKNIEKTLTKVIDKTVDNYQDGEGKIILGYDTRESSPFLCSLIVKVLSIVNCPFINYDYVTTPQLHFLVFLLQKQIKDDLLNKVLNKRDFSISDQYGTYVDIGKDLYFQLYGNIFKVFNDLYDKISNIKKKQLSNYTNELIIDMGNGVAGLKSIRCLLQENFDLKFDFINCNTEEFNLLNVESGAEFVQKYFLLPKSVDNKSPFGKMCSYDGDADRIIYL